MVAKPVETFPPGLRGNLSSLPKIALAFSGGMDSRFLCHAALLCGCEILLLHAAGPHVPKRDSAFAHAWAKSRGLALVDLRLDPLALPPVAAGSRERCYHCKHALFESMRDWLMRNGKNGFALCDGTNGDDLAAHRPGNRAAAELGVISPLAGLSKNEIRGLAAATGLDLPEQKARPCLLTRFAYDVRPDYARLAALDAAEAEIESLLEAAGHGGADFRLRLLPAPELHLNGAAQAEAPAALRIAERHGFAPCALRLADGISGYFDRQPGH